MKWEKSKIKDVCKGIYDGPHATPPPSDTGGIFLGISNITNGGHLDLTKVRYINKKDLPKWTKRVVPQSGDIVFSYEATLGLYAIIPSDFYGCLGRRMALIRPNEEIVRGKYLYYYFLSPEWQAIIQENTVVGATVDRIPLIKFPDFVISYPSLAFQDKIINILSAYDDLIENNRRQIALLEEAASRLYKEWFVDFHFPGHEQVKIVDGMPEGWRMSCIGEISLTLSGGTPSRTHLEYYNNGNIPWVKTKELNDGFIFDTEEKITEEAVKKSSTKLFPKRSIILAMYGATIGKLGISSKSMCCNQACCVFILEDNYLFEYFYLWLINNRNMLINRGRGAAQSNLSQELIRQLEICIPSKEILMLFSESISKIFDIKELLQKKIVLMCEARDRLLPKLMSGEIEVRP